MRFRKQTSLILILGLIFSLFHPLAHAGSQWSPGQHGSFAAQGQSGHKSAAMSIAQPIDHNEHFQVPSSGRHGSDFATTYCEVCHVFAHIFAIGGIEKNPPVTKMPGFVSIVNSPVTADVLRFDRPPRAII